MVIALLVVGVIVLLLTIRSKTGRKQVGPPPVSPSSKELPSARPMYSDASPSKSKAVEFSPELLAWAQKIADAPTEQDIEQAEEELAQEIEAIESRNAKQKPFLTTDEARQLLSLLGSESRLTDKLEGEKGTTGSLESSAHRILIRWGDAAGAVVTEDGLPELLKAGMSERERREYEETCAAQRHDLLVALREHFRSRVPTERWVRAFVPTEKSRALAEAEKAKSPNGARRNPFPNALVHSGGSIQERPWDWFQRMRREGRTLSRSELVEAVGEESCMALLGHCRWTAESGFLNAYSGGRVFFELDSRLEAAPSQWLREGPASSVRMLGADAMAEVATALDEWFADYVRDHQEQKRPTHPSIDAWLAQWDEKQKGRAEAERELRKEQEAAMKERASGRFTLHQAAVSNKDG